MAQAPKAAAEGEGPWKTARFPDATGSQSLIFFVHPRLLRFLEALNQGCKAVFLFFGEITLIDRNHGNKFLLKQLTGLQLSVLRAAVKQLEALPSLCQHGWSCLMVMKCCTAGFQEAKSL